MRVKRLGDAPGDGVFVGQAKNQALSFLPVSFMVSPDFLFSARQRAHPASRSATAWTATVPASCPGRSRGPAAICSGATAGAFSIHITPSAQKDMPRCDGHREPAPGPAWPGRLSSRGAGARPAAGHERLPFQRRQRADEHRAGRTGPAGDDVEHPVHAVGEIHVDVSRRAKHHLRARRGTPAIGRAVTGQVQCGPVAVRFRFDDAPGDAHPVASVHQVLTQQRLRHLARRARIVGFRPASVYHPAIVPKNPRSKTAQVLKPARCGDFVVGNRPLPALRIDPPMALLPPAPPPAFETRGIPLQYPECETTYD